MARARARPARLRMPPDSSAGFSVAARAGRPTRAIFRSAMGRRSRAGAGGCARTAAPRRSRARSGSRTARPAGTARPSAARPTTSAGARPPHVAAEQHGPGPSGAFRPMMVLSSTDLPVPEPPDHAEDRRRARPRRSRPSWTPVSPNRGTPGPAPRSDRSRCLGSWRTSARGMRERRSYVQLHVDQGEDRIDQDDREDRVDHRGGHAPAQGLHVVADLHALAAADGGDDRRP